MRYTKILTLGEDRVKKIKEVIVSCDFTRSHDSIELALSSIKYDNIDHIISALRMIEGEIISKINKCPMLVIVGYLELHALSINDINYVIFNGKNEKLKAIEDEIKNVAKTIFNKDIKTNTQKVKYVSDLSQNIQGQVIAMNSK